MSLQARQFFAELCLPFTDSTVVGNTYATPIAGAALRLRISFTEMIHANTYGGLRVAVVHADRGEIDAVALNFVDHGTFHRRDEAQNTPRNSREYGTFNTYHRRGQPPWEGAVVTDLRDAVEQYTGVWFPDAWKTPTPFRVAGRTAQKAPAPTVSRTAGRTR
ncbi:hypothetical protein DDE74_36590 [Streptomyces lydicus]|uniref:Uncharacterized protein n=1 Tax=Streptomyces lydicus TaxID=47763 RepID=A0A3Q9KEC8_9ACTN|nr:hypothetical protein [Streptomyces lydicus]AZS75685.1 hypothetical protein DDE74_36590 [Streptomyces lydicus]